MKASRKLRKFSVKLVIHNISETSDPNILSDLAEIIAMRPHLAKVELFQDIVSRRVFVTLALDSITKEIAAKQTAEELYEMLSAILHYIEGVRIEVIDTKPIG